MKKKFGFIMLLLFTLCLSFIFTACNSPNNSGSDNDNGGNTNPTTYTVSFEPNGGSEVSTQIIDIGSSIAVSPQTTKVDYNFDGWFENVSLSGYAVTFPYIPIKSLTLYAKWNSSSGGDVTPVEIFKYSLINSATQYEISVASGITLSGAVNIPSTYNGKSVTAIAAYGFMDNSAVNSNTRTNEITTLTLPSSITSIGAYAFYGCRNMNLSLPSNLATIDTYAFYNCTSLTSLTIPTSVTSIGRTAFGNCTALSSLTIPFVGQMLNGTSNTHLGYIFGTSSYIGQGSYIPASLKIITITGNTIGENAFWECSGLTSVIITSSVTSIGNSAFANCTGLASITIPTSVTSIAWQAFGGCTGLTSIIIPSSVTSIGERTFVACSNLASITIPFVGQLSNETGYRNFGYIFGATSYYNQYEYIPQSLKTVIVTGGSSIVGNAFYGCASLTNITIPNSVTSIGGAAFYGCTGLTTIALPFIGGNRNASADDGVFGYIFGQELTYDTGITSPSGTIFQYSYVDYNDYVHPAHFFHYYIPQSLRTVVITNATKISRNAFYNCAMLTSLIINSAAQSNIGSEAFINCIAPIYA